MKYSPMNSRSRPILAVLLVGILVALLNVRTRQMRQEQAKPLGCLTAQQVLNLSEPICQAVAAGFGPLTLTADASRGLHNSWKVACSDAAGSDRIYVTWNADTARLSGVSVRGYHTHTGPLLNSAMANAWGRFWLRSLQLSPASGEWSLLHVPVCIGKIRWSLEYAAQGRRVSLQLEAHTGALVNALIMPSDSEQAPRKLNLLDTKDILW